MVIDQKLKAFLGMVAWSEGTSTSKLTKNDGYDVGVTGVNGPWIFTSYADHPFANGSSVLVRENPPLYSTAAGRYQLLLRYWKVYRVQLNLPDFSPASQDAVAVQQIKERGAILDIEADNIPLAITLCSNIWASLPGNNYGQPVHSPDALMAKYAELLSAE